MKLSLLILKLGIYFLKISLTLTTKLQSYDNIIIRMSDTHKYIEPHHTQGSYHKVHDN